MRKLLIVFLVASIGVMGISAPAQKPSIGVIAGIEKDSVLYAAGYRYIEEAVARSFSPRALSEEQFNQKLPAIIHTKCKVAAANVFFPSVIKLVGPDVREQEVLGYTDTVMRRCFAAGLRIVVLGSGGARKLPDGYNKEKAKAEFVVLVRKMAEVAAKYHMVIAIENLNHTEVNFINTLAEALEIVKKVDHPNFRLTADIYHMLMEDESPAAIEAAGALLVHCHIAEEKERAYPGKWGEDFRPYFRALKKINFSGIISLECGWKNIDTESAPALVYLQRQLDEAYDK